MVTLICVLKPQFFHLVAVKVVQWLSPSLLFHFCLFHAAAAVESADRSPRPTSAPAIAPSQAAEGGVPGAPVKKAQKETVQVEVKQEEALSEDAEPEPTEAWKVCRKPRGPAHSLLVQRCWLLEQEGSQSTGFC